MHLLLLHAEAKINIIPTDIPSFEVMILSLLIIIMVSK